MTPGRGTGAGSDPGPGEVPHRVRVTAPQREARRRADRPSRSAELAQQTALGEIYLAALLRAQLRLGLAVLSVAAVVLAGIPLLFLLVPQVATTRIGPAPLPWVVVGLAVYPVVAFGARFYVAQCERLERDFVELVSQQ
ncbi:MAG: hypothetical protein U0Q14_10900 [Dermatophilaceae bacterium]